MLGFSPLASIPLASGPLGVEADVGPSPEPEPIPVDIATGGGGYHRNERRVEELEDRMLALLRKKRKRAEPEEREEFVEAVVAAVAEAAEVAQPVEEVRALVLDDVGRILRLRNAERAREELDLAIERAIEAAIAAEEARLRLEAELKRRQFNAALAMLLLVA